MHLIVRTNTANNRVYGYDALGRLTSASGPWGGGSFIYDALGNIRSKTLGTRTVNNVYDNALNRVTQTADTVRGTRAIAHDARGNITALGGLNFAYDTSDQPTSISGSASGAYLYDGNRKLVRSVVNGKTIYNVYDAGGTLSHVYDASTGKRTDYIGQILRITNGTVTYLHKDHLGSASSGTTSTGAVAWNEQYTLSHCRGLFHLQMIHWIICSAFADQFQSGETILNPAANDNLDGFTGHIKDKATGLQPLPGPSSFKIDSLDQFFGFANQLRSMQARYYDPALGRFLSIDPVGFSPDQPFMFNRYTYVGNDPINAWDPFGTECVNADDGNTTCTTNDYDVTFETPKGFPGSDPDGENGHYYNTQAQSPLGAEETRDFVKNNPTPGNPKPATPEGTVNDATPVIGGLPGNISPVESITTTNNVSGNEVVVNVTLPGHPLFPGIVVRDVSPNSDGTSTINNYGEGNGALQKPGGRFANRINGVWKGEVPRAPVDPSNICRTCP